MNSEVSVSSRVPFRESSKFSWNTREIPTRAQDCFYYSDPGIYPIIYRLQVHVLFPVRVAPAEFSFLFLKLLKTWFVTLMTEQRIMKLAVIYIR